MEAEMASKEHDERRRSRRYDLETEVTGRIRPSMEVKVLNLSEYGMLIETPFGLPPRGTCEMTVKAPSGPKIIRAKVARCRANMVKKDDGKVSILFHAGLEFNESFAAGQEIKDLISEVCLVDVPIDADMATDLGENLERAM
jgi:hypothetical protein